MPLAVSCSRAAKQHRAVDQQILCVNRQAVTQRRRFGRLQVRVAHANEVGVALDLQLERAQQVVDSPATIWSSASRMRNVSTVSSMSIDVAPRWIFPPPTVAWLA